MNAKRRKFLVSSVATGLALAAPAVLRGQPEDKKFRTATIGTGWWGKVITRNAIKTGTVDIVAVCDVDQRMVSGAAEEVNKVTGKSPKQYKDFRELLDQEKPEICIVATPDHWHPLIAIAACKAGAHVYVEKPIGHTILEGRAMVKAARDNGRVVQVDTHRRVSPHHISARQFVQEGKLGKLGMVRAFVYGGGGAGQPTPDSDPPPGMDWDMWCGPAPVRPFNRRIHPRGWRQFLDYANGQLGDWGPHWLDQILWFTGEQYPKKVYSTGGRHIVRDNTDAPDTQVVTYEFESFTAVWEHRQYAGSRPDGHSVGLFFCGTEGMLHVGWQDGMTFYPRDAGQPTIHEDAKLHDQEAHNIPELWADFIDSIKTGKRPICDIEEGHRATTMTLLGMLSLKLGRSVQWDGEKEECVGDPEANKLLRREYRAPWVYPAA